MALMCKPASVWWCGMEKICIYVQFLRHMSLTTVSRLVEIDEWVKQDISENDNWAHYERKSSEIQYEIYEKWWSNLCDEEL